MAPPSDLAGKRIGEFGANRARDGVLQTVRPCFWRDAIASCRRRENAREAHHANPERSPARADEDCPNDALIMPGEWLTYAQAGARFGLSADAIRMRAHRLGWRTQPGNDGRTLVQVPEDAAVKPRARSAEQSPERETEDLPHKMERSRG